MCQNPAAPPTRPSRPSSLCAAAALLAALLSGCASTGYVDDESGTITVSRKSTSAVKAARSVIASYGWHIIDEGVTSNESSTRPLRESLSGFPSGPTASIEDSPSYTRQYSWINALTSNGKHASFAFLKSKDQPLTIFITVDDAAERSLPDVTRALASRLGLRPPAKPASPAPPAR